MKTPEIDINRSEDSGESFGTRAEVRLHELFEGNVDILVKGKLMLLEDFGQEFENLEDFIANVESESRETEELINLFIDKSEKFGHTVSKHVLNEQTSEMFEEQLSNYALQSIYRFLKTSLVDIPSANKIHQKKQSGYSDLLKGKNEEVLLQETIQEVRNMYIEVFESIRKGRVRSSRFEVSKMKNENLKIDFLEDPILDSVFHDRYGLINALKTVLSRPGILKNIDSKSDLTNKYGTTQILIREVMSKGIMVKGLSLNSGDGVYVDYSEDQDNPRIFFQVHLQDFMVNNISTVFQLNKSEILHVNLLTCFPDIKRDIEQDGVLRLDDGEIVNVSITLEELIEFETKLMLSSLGKS